MIAICDLLVVMRNEAKTDGAPPVVLNRMDSTISTFLDSLIFTEKPSQSHPIWSYYNPI